MRRILLFILFVCIGTSSFAQGFGLGYQFDIGWSNKSNPSSAYDQSIRTYIHSGFIRFHNTGGNVALKFMIGYRSDTIRFRNYSAFLASDGSSMMQYNTNALLRRNAWRFGVINQYQFHIYTARIVCSLNTGLFYEHTIRAIRSGSLDGRRYLLDEELNRNNIGIIAGGEIRFVCFTLGFKYEKLFRDVLNHDYILSQDLNLNNSTELRGLRLNPGMAFLYLGISLDFFDYR